MNIVLACSRYPAGDADRINTERDRMAVALGELGHNVHLLAPARPGRAQSAESVGRLLIPSPPRINNYSAADPSLDYPLTYSQLVHESLLQLRASTAVDIVDAPLEGATGLVSLVHHDGPVVLYMSDSRDGVENDPAQGLLEECVARAAGILASNPAQLERARQMGARCGDALMRVVGPAAGTPNAELQARFYSDVISDSSRRTRRTAERVVQLMDALDYGDAVSSLALRNAELLGENGAVSPILSIYAHPLVADRRLPFDPASVDASNDSLLFHFWGFSSLEGFLRAFRGRKAVHFHNMTPSAYFSRGSRDYEMTSRGYQQLARIAGWFDLIIGDSEFNLDEFARHLPVARPTLCLYPTIEAASVLSQEKDEDLLASLKASDCTTFLFVGRIARNKRQDQVMRLFDHYHREVDSSSRLFLVGSHEQNPDYLRELEDLRDTLRSGGKIFFTGKVSDQAVRAYYDSADVFISASEHEGFGVPVVEAMAHGVPVVALARTAVAEGLGTAGVRVDEWDVPRILERLESILKDPSERERLLAGQRLNLSRFSRSEARTRLAQASAFLLNGSMGSLMTWRGGEARG